MIQLVVFDNRNQALEFVNELQRRDIACSLDEDGHVFVEPDAFEAAFAVVLAAELVSASPWTGEACPACGSHHVQNVGVDWKHASWGFLLLCACLLGLPLLWRQRVHQCLSCGEHWEALR
jgi:hypothetical protein